MSLSIAFGPYTREFLDLSWVWLRDPEIKALTLTPDFDREDQEEWFNSLARKDWYLIWGIFCDGRPVGVCGLKIDGQQGEYWGYIGEKQLWGHGIGFEMLQHVEAEAKRKGLLSLWLKVGVCNLRATKLYNRSGFQRDPESSSTELTIMRKKLAD